jgi:energy-coupling factor transporter transmembrane protein EcfT
MIMNINVIEGRATIRLFVGGMICAQAAYFYFLNQFFAKNNTRYLVLSLLTLSIFILQGTRQLIFALIFLTLIYLLFSRRIKSRFLIALIFSLAVVSFFLIFREIFVELTKVSSSQMQNLSGGIRIKAARFYLTNFMPNAWAYIFGNSNSGLGSAYDQQIFLYAFKYGFYTSDIGILGDYVKYGIVFTIAGLVMLIKAICFKISDKYSFLKYYIFSQCFTLITGYGIFGGVDIVMVLSLYIFDVDRAAILFTKNREKNNQDISLKKPIQLP